MAISDEFPFDDAHTAQAPDENGVYLLYDAGELIYVGRSGTAPLDAGSIRSRLRDHLFGHDGPCTQDATHFAYELHDDPETAEWFYLLEAKQNLGRFPRCND